MNTITVLSLGQTPGQYSARARAQARLFTQARQRENIDYNIRTWRPDRPRVRAQRSGRSNLPPIPFTEAEIQRRAEAKAKASARLQRIFQPDPRQRRTASGSFTSGYARFLQAQNKLIALRARERRIADEQAELARRLDQARRMAEARELGRRRAAAQAMPDPRQVIVPTSPPITPPPITPLPLLPTPAMPQSEAWGRQSTEDLQRLVDARRKLGIRG